MKNLLTRASIEAGGTFLLAFTATGSAFLSSKTPFAPLLCGIATALALALNILWLGAISGAHVNPVITLANAVMGRFDWREVPVYCLAQMAGAVLAMVALHLLCGLPSLVLSEQERTGYDVLVMEFMVSFGLLSVIWGSSSKGSRVMATTVGIYTATAIYFSSAHALINPALDFAYAFTTLVTGVRLIDIPALVFVQVMGGIMATILFRQLSSSLKIN